MSIFGDRDTFKVKNLTVMGILLAMAVVINFVSFYATATFRIFSIAYIPGMVVSMLFGPIAGGVFALASDTVCYLTKSAGGYFFGYAISALVMNVIYAIFLYKQKLKLYKVVLAQLCITVFVNMGLNYLWVSIMAGTASATFFTGARLLNNLIQLPFHIALVYFIVKFIRKNNRLAFLKDKKATTNDKQNQP
ncbi:MAG: folate family ECF transporter S component [Clostridia bacterium]